MNSFVGGNRKENCFFPIILIYVYRRFPPCSSNFILALRPRLSLRKKVIETETKMNTLGNHFRVLHTGILFHWTEKSFFNMSAYNFMWSWIVSNAQDKEVYPKETFKNQYPIEKIICCCFEKPYLNLNPLQKPIRGIKGNSVLDIVSAGREKGKTYRQSINVNKENFNSLGMNIIIKAKFVFYIRSLVPEI